MSRLPPDLHSAQCYERLAPQVLAGPVLAYVNGGSGRDLTVAANRAGWDAWHVCPRLLADVRLGHTRVRLGGSEWSRPFALAPVAHHRLAHAEGERATAMGAAAADVCMMASTLSNCPLEAIAEAGGDHALRWFQLYLQPSRDESLALVRRAAQAGYQAIVLTLDASIQLPSIRALSAGFSLPAECTLGNWREAPEPVPLPTGHLGSRVFQGLMQSAPRWDDLDWLLAHSPLPVWVKGVLHLEDALALQARGVAGLVVSNHGGRGLDGAPSTARMLPLIRQVVGPELPLLVDGGIRSGTDVFKALALGAQGVLIGRLQLHALALGGALGVAHMLQMLGEELEVCMALAGCARVSDIHPGCLIEAAPAIPGGMTC